jgi:hypothetical protein
MWTDVQVHDFPITRPFFRFVYRTGPKRVVETSSRQAY